MTALVGEMSGPDHTTYVGPSPVGRDPGQRTDLRSDPHTPGTPPTFTPGPGEEGVGSAGLRPRAPKRPRRPRPNTASGRGREVKTWRRAPGSEASPHLPPEPSVSGVESGVSGSLLGDRQMPPEPRPYPSPTLVRPGAEGPRSLNTGLGIGKAGLANVPPDPGRVVP